MNNEQVADRKSQVAKLKRGMGLQKTLEAASEILGNPLIMFDISFNLLACTGNTVTDDPLWNELTTLGKFSHTTVDFINTEKFIQLYAKSDVVAYMHSDKLKYDRANAILFDNDGTQIADIIVVACYKGFVDEDFALLESISEIISAELQDSDVYQSLGRVLPESIVSDLLEGNIIDSASVESVIQNLHSELKPNLFVAVIDVIKYEPTLTHLQYFKDLFKSIQAEYKYFVYLNNVVAIIHTDNPTLSIKKDLKKLNALFSKYNIYAGISDSFQSLYDLQKHYKRAINALNFGTTSMCVHNIFKYDDFRLDYFLKSINDDTDLSCLCNPIVPLIKKYDEERETIYLDTIYAYLLAGKNTTTASQVLAISCAELRCRLKAVTEIFGVDWNDGNMIYSIFTSIKLSDTQLN